MSLGAKAFGEQARLRLARERRTDRTIEEDRIAITRGGLSEYIRRAWRWVEPLDFVTGWHVDMISEHLEAVTLGDIRRLVINIPPGCMKSLEVCVFWPSWTWLPEIDPAHKFIFTSFAESNARRDAIRARTLIESDWHKERWAVRLSHTASRSAGFYSNTHGGFRFSTSVRGQITGKHGDTQVVDDPTSPGEAVHRKKLEGVLDWWSTTMPTRQANPKTGRRVIVMQRIHELDLAGAMAREGGYEFLTLPMEFEEARKCYTFGQRLTVDGRIERDPAKPIGADPRTREGELLWPERFDAGTVKELRRTLGPIAASAQLDQNPSPAAGAIFKPPYFLKRYKVLPANDSLYFVQSWDCRFKSDNESGDYVVGQVWAALFAEFFLVDQVRGRWSLSETIQAMLDLGAKWPRCYKVLIENKANGPAVENAIGKKVAGIELVEPKGGKIARANAVEPVLAAGNVHYPDASIAPWILDHISEHTAFPKAAHDDQVDTATQALTYLVETSRKLYGEAWSTALADLKAGQPARVIHAQPIVTPTAPVFDTFEEALERRLKAG